MLLDYLVVCKSNLHVFFGSQITIILLSPLLNWVYMINFTSGDINNNTWKSGKYQQTCFKLLWLLAKSLYFFGHSFPDLQNQILRKESLILYFLFLFALFLFSPFFLSFPFTFEDIFISSFYFERGAHYLTKGNFYFLCSKW